MAKKSAKARKKTKAPARKAKSAGKAKTKRKAKRAAGEHPKLATLYKMFPPGRYAGGTLIVTEPGAHHQQMSSWLMGKVQGRVALGRTAFGDILVFRDLRQRAAEQGLPGVRDACDVSLIDLNYKRMTVLAWSVEEFYAMVDDAEFQRAHLRKKLYDRVRARLGDFADDEAYAFVPALALGGSEKASSVERSNWDVYQDILFQL